MRKKFSIVLLTGIIACILFAIIIVIEKQLVKTTPYIDVVVAKDNIKQGEILNAGKFTYTKIPITSIDPDMIKSLDKINSFYSLENIYKGDILNKNRISDKNSSKNPLLKSDELEISIPISKFSSDVFPGTLRRDDLVDISHTDKNGDNTPVSVFIGKRIRVLGAVDSQGKFLEPGDKNIVASSIMFAGSEDDFLKISGMMQSGSFSIAKCSKTVTAGTKEAKSIATP